MVWLGIPQLQDILENNMELNKELEIFAINEARLIHILSSFDLK